jgi:aminoglycoside 3-N-acetyltransferase
MTGIPQQQHHYTKQQLVDAIRAVGIGAGDVVSLQVSLGRLGLPQGAADFAGIAAMVADAFLEVLTETGTLIVPTYTYSIGRGETYDVDLSPSAIGEFPELFRKRAGAVRSRDPMLSSAGVGPKATRVLREISRSCYGRDSTFDRLREVDAKICTLGISLYWATFRHHIEEMCAVPFRFKKTFQGTIRERGVDSVEAWTYFAAPTGISNCEPNGRPLEMMAREKALVRIEPIGRGEIMCVDACAYFDLGVEALTRNPWLTAKGPPCDIREAVNSEMEGIAAWDAT